MNKLEKIEQSCIDFSEDLKTGSILWQKEEHDYFAYVFKITTNIGIVKLFWQGNKFFYTFCDKSIYLKSETAKEAAFEALELVKEEAQKLVNALSEPPKSPWTKIDPIYLPPTEVFAINEAGEGLAGVITRPNRENALYCESENDSILNPTHYLTYEQILKIIPKP